MIIFEIISGAVITIGIALFVFCLLRLAVRDFKHYPYSSFILLIAISMIFLTLLGVL